MFDNLLHAQYEYFDPETEYYSKLGLEKCNTSLQQIKSKFRELSKIMHPDKGGDADAWRGIVEARDYLVSNHTRLAGKCNTTTDSSSDVTSGSTTQQQPWGGQPWSYNTTTAFILASLVFVTAMFAGKFVGGNQDNSLLIYSLVIAVVAFSITLYITAKPSAGADLPMSSGAIGPSAPEIAAPEKPLAIDAPDRAPEISAPEKPPAISAPEKLPAIDAPEIANATAVTDTTSVIDTTSVTDTTSIIDTASINATASNTTSAGSGASDLSKYIKIFLPLAIGGLVLAFISFGGASGIPFSGAAGAVGTIPVYFLVGGGLLGLIGYLLYKFGPTLKVPDQLKRKPDFLDTIVNTVKTYYKAPVILMAIIVGILLVIKNINYLPRLLPSGGSFAWNPVYEVLIIGVLVYMTSLNWTTIKRYIPNKDVINAIEYTTPVSMTLIVTMLYAFIRIFLPRAITMVKSRGTGSTGLSGLNGLNLNFLDTAATVYITFIACIPLLYLLPREYKPVAFYTLILSALFLIFKLGSYTAYMVAIVTMVIIMDRYIGNDVLFGFTPPPPSDAKKPKDNDSKGQTNWMQSMGWMQWGSLIIFVIICAMLLIKLMRPKGRSPTPWDYTYTTYTTTSYPVSRSRSSAYSGTSTGTNSDTSAPTGTGAQSALTGKIVTFLVLCTGLGTVLYIFKDQIQNIVKTINLWLSTPTTSGNAVIPPTVAPTPVASTPPPTPPVVPSSPSSIQPQRPLTQSQLMRPPTYYTATGTGETNTGTQPVTTTDEDTLASYPQNAVVNQNAGKFMYHEHTRTPLGHSHYLVPFQDGDSAGRTCLCKSDITGPKWASPVKFFFTNTMI